MLALWVGLAPASALAEVEVHAESAAGCPDVGARIAGSLGPALTRETALVRVSIVAAAGGVGFVGHVVIEHAGSVPVEQTLGDPSCAVLADAIALVVAITIDPDLFGREEGAAADAGDGSDAGSEPDERPPPIDEASPTPPAGRPRLGGLFRIAGGGALGLGPDVAATLEVAAGVTLDDWVRLEASARGVLPQVVRYLPVGEAGADVGLLWGELGVCLVPHLAAELALGGCARVQVGAALGTGRGIAEPISAAAPWVAIAASARLEWWMLSELALVLSLEAAVPVVRPVFSIEGLGRLYRPEPVGGTLALGLEIHLS